jgi:hypothetical protein
MEEREMNKTLISFGIVIILIYAGLSGCIDQKSFDKYSEEDLLFLQWVMEVNRNLNAEGSNINNASINEDLLEEFNSSIKLKEEIHTYAYVINNFTLSSIEITNIRNEFYGLLYDFYQYADYHEKAAVTEMEGDYNSTLYYLDQIMNTNEHLNSRQSKILNMITLLDTKSKTIFLILFID